MADASNNGFHTFETFKEGWAADAYKQGYDKGSKIENFFKNFFGKKMVEKEYKQKMPELADNSIKNDMDLDGITEHLRSTMEEQMAAAAEGVH